MSHLKNHSFTGRHSRQSRFNAPAKLEAVQAALSDQGVKAKILKMGIEARSSTPRELDDLDRSELARWGDVVKASGYVPE